MYLIYWTHLLNFEFWLMSVYFPEDGLLNESIIIPFQPQFITDNALTTTNVCPLFSKILIDVWYAAIFVHASHI